MAKTKRLTKKPVATLDGKCVLVTWGDATHIQGWRHKEEFNEHEPLICNSVGWVIKLDDKVIQIAQSTNPASCGDVLMVPRAMIRSIKEMGAV